MKPDIFLFVLVIMLFVIVLSSLCYGHGNQDLNVDPPHGPDASLTDILNHIRFDRKYLGLDNTLLSKDIQILLRESAYPPGDQNLAANYPSWSCNGAGANRRCSAPSYTMSDQTYQIKYYPQYQDWDVIPY